MKVTEFFEKYLKETARIGVRDENGKFLPWNDPKVARVRSKTYEGIADAIAQQWGSQKYCMQISLF